MEAALALRPTLPVLPFFYAGVFFLFSVGWPTCRYIACDFHFIFELGFKFIFKFLVIVEIVELSILPFTLHHFLYFITD